MVSTLAGVSNGSGTATSHERYASTLKKQLQSSHKKVSNNLRVDVGSLPNQTCADLSSRVVNTAAQASHQSMVFSNDVSETDNNTAALQLQQSSHVLSKRLPTNPTLKTSNTQQDDYREQQFGDFQPDPMQYLVTDANLLERMINQDLNQVIPGKDQINSKKKIIASEQ